jgi:exonuclease VII small subunit
VTPVQSASPLINEHEQELQQLRESVALLTNQCAQLNEANRAWLQYQQTQLDNFREKIQDYLPMEENSSLEHAAQQIVDQITRERQDYTAQYQALERTNHDLRSGNSVIHHRFPS